MKKSIAIILSAAMAVSAVPQAAFASTKNYVSKIKSVKVDDEFNTSITMDEFKGTASGLEKQTVKLTLTNAEFLDSQTSGSIKDYEDNLNTAKENVTKAQRDLAAAQQAKNDADNAVAEAQKAYDDALANGGITEEAYNSAQKAYDNAKSAYGAAKSVYDNSVADYNHKKTVQETAKNS